MIKTEQDVQNLSRLEESKLGNKQFRNQIGAMRTPEGRFIRFGLGNESARLNAVIKSGDFVGIQEKVITQEMVGSTIGQFTSREYKKPNWKYSGTDREKAQVRWANMINRMGGDAKFVTYKLGQGLVYWCPGKEDLV